MRISKDTSCILSEIGHYNMFYMSKKVSHFNQDCIVEAKSFVNIQNRKYIAVQTESKNVGIHESDSNSTVPIVVWIENT
jgi:hypothetical protein